MSSLHVVFRNDKVTLSIPNNEIMADLFKKACKHFRLDENKYQLVYGANTLNLSLPFRLSAIPNQSRVTIIEKRGDASASGVKTVRIAIQLSDGKRYQSNLSTSQTLWDILLHFEEKEKLCLLKQFTPDLKYLQPHISFLHHQINTIEKLQSTTLQELKVIESTLIKVEFKPTDMYTKDQACEMIVDYKPPVKEEPIVSPPPITKPTTTTTTTTTVTSPTSSVSSSTSTNLQSPPPSNLPISPQDSNNNSNDVEASSSSSSQPSMDIDTNNNNNNNSNNNNNKDSSMETETPKPKKMVTITLPAKNNINYYEAAPKQPEPEPFRFPARSDQDKSKNEQKVKVPKELPIMEAKDRDLKVYIPVENDLDPSKIIFDAKMTEEDFKRLVEGNKRTKQAKEEFNSILRTKEMREREEQSKLKKFTHSTIRVYFPGKNVLEMTFLSKEKIQNLLDYIKTLLSTYDPNIFLYTTPPYKILDLDSTFLKEGLIPRAKIFFGIPKGGVVTFNEEVNQLFRSAEQEPLISLSSCIQNNDINNTTATTTTNTTTNVDSKDDDNDVKMKQEQEPVDPVIEAGVQERKQAIVPKWLLAGKKF